jgi:hypothetical protein
MKPAGNLVALAVCQAIPARLPRPVRLLCAVTGKHVAGAVRAGGPGRERLRHAHE